MKFDGKDFNLFVDGDAVFGSTDISVDIDATRLDGTSRTSGDFEDAISGDYGGTATINFLFTEDDQSGEEGAKSILNAQLAKTQVTCTFRRSDPANTAIDKYYVFDAYIADATYTFNRNEIAAGNITLQIDGQIEIEDES